MLKYLKCCEEIEETVGLIYRRLAEVVTCDDRLKSIWIQLAKDEDDHALQVRFALRLKPEELFEGQRLSILKVEQLLQRAKSILQGIDQLPMSEKDALRVSMKLEEEFLQLHMASAAVFKDQHMKDMFRCLATEDEDHVAILRKYYLDAFEESDESMAKRS